MSNIARLAPGRRSVTTILVAVALGALTTGLLANTSRAPASERSISPKALALHDAMRALWESHGRWTERAIVDFVGDLPDTKLVINRLLQNQTDIGNAVKPFYGTTAGNKLTKRSKVTSTPR